MQNWNQNQFQICEIKRFIGDEFEEYLLKVRDADGTMILEQVIRHDIKFDYDETVDSVIRIFTDSHGQIGIEIEDRKKRNEFLKAIDNIKNPEIEKFISEFGDINTFVKRQNETEDQLYILSIMMNRQDEQFRRGSVVKAIAIVSKYRFVESFKRIVHDSLNDYFDRSLEKDTEAATQVLKNLYEKKFDLSELNSIDHFERRVLYDFYYL